MAKNPMMFQVTFQGPEIYRFESVLCPREFFSDVEKKCFCEAYFIYRGGLDRSCASQHFVSKSLSYSRCLLQFLQVARLNRNSGLSQIALQKRQCRWKQRPKIHQVHHIIMSYLPKKPKSFGNYLDEDFVRLVKTRAATCHPKSLGKTVLWKYSLSMCIRWGVLKL